MKDRPDLDGCRVQLKGQNDVWLVYHGKRHRIGSPAVYDSLFTGVETILHDQDVDAIMPGVELHDGACLVRPEGSLSIYLINRTLPNAVTRHHIPNWETLCDFGFDEAKVRTVPSILIEVLPGGGDLLSPRGRRILLS